MNIGFLEEYYQLKYPDTIMMYILEADKTCRELYKDIMQLEGRVEDAMRGMGRECLALHDKLFSMKGQLDERIVWLAYLQGAKDREEMLK